LLITGILWRDRSRFAGGNARPRLFADFSLRRALRIFPTYYLTICYAWIAKLGIFSGSLPWFAAYLTNVYIVRHGLPGSSTHLWSLAVEEQFY
jgi:peptidoglycan/LPS O-acetylase OafA/YrhL